MYIYKYIVTFIRNLNLTSPIVKTMSFLIKAFQTLAVCINIAFIGTIFTVCQFTLLLSELSCSVNFQNLTLLSSDVEQINREYGSQTTEKITP